MQNVQRISNDVRKGAPKASEGILSNKFSAIINSFNLEVN